MNVCRRQQHGEHKSEMEACPMFAFKSPWPVNLSNYSAIVLLRHHKMPTVLCAKAERWCSGSISCVIVAEKKNLIKILHHIAFLERQNLLFWNNFSHLTVFRS